MDKHSKYQNSLREFELNQVVRLFPQESRILEIGAGPGYQVRRLKESGFSVEAIDIEVDESSEANGVTKYDGMNIPFPDHSFDIIFSSNTLEHIRNLEEFQVEIKRVLKPDGRAIHILPTANWRFWSLIAHVLNWVKIVYKLIVILAKRPSNGQDKNLSGRRTVEGIKSRKNIQENLRTRLLICRHGERGNVFTEIYYFSRLFWVPFFKKAGWKIDVRFPSRLFYTDVQIFGHCLKINSRNHLSYLLGSACMVYVLKK